MCVLVMLLGLAYLMSPLILRDPMAELLYIIDKISGPKIAIITGMHPREISAKNLVPEVIKTYVNSHNVEIVNYQINVTQDP